MVNLDGLLCIPCCKSSQRGGPVPIYGKSEFSTKSEKTRVFLFYIIKVLQNIPNYLKHSTWPPLCLLCLSLSPPLLPLPAPSYCLPPTSWSSLRTKQPHLPRCPHLRCCSHPPGLKEPVPPEPPRPAGLLPPRRRHLHRRAPGRLSSRLWLPAPTPAPATGGYHCKKGKEARKRMVKSGCEKKKLKLVC